MAGGGGGGKGKENEKAAGAAAGGKDKPEGEQPAAAKEAPKVPPVAPIVQLLRRLEDELSGIEKAVANADVVLMVRAARYINTLRRYVRSKVLGHLIGRALAAGPDRDSLLAKLAAVGPEPALVWPVPEKPKADEEEKRPGKDAAAAAAAAAEDVPMDGSEKPLWDGMEGDDQLGSPGNRSKPVPELVFYLSLLVGLRLLDAGRLAEAFSVFAELVKSVPLLNRRTLDPLAAKAYAFYALVGERLGRAGNDDMPFFLQAYRTSCLHHDEPSQTVLTNVILRLYLRASLFAQADKFRLNTKMPESASPAHHARYLLYLGKINAIQLHYSDALDNLNQSLRKGPQRGAVGFRLEVQKLLLIVQLLMGDMPERALFRDPDLGRALAPYYQLTHAVYTGNLAGFGDVMRKFQAQFVRDRCYTLIVRLRQNVIKTGLRKICMSYSRISVADVVSKLKLESREAAEFVIAKAIHDGVIEGVLDHQAGVLVSKENTEVYHTQEPQQAFHRRVQFCLDVHNEAVKALRFPMATAPSANQTEELGDTDDGGGMFMDMGDD